MQFMAVESGESRMPPNITLLGTGGPRRDPTRRSTALLLRTGEEDVLIDAGRGAIHGLGEAGADLSHLTRLVLTHHHFDHIGDLYDVMLNTWLEGRKERLLVEGPPDTARLVNALLTQVYDKDYLWRSLGEPAHGGWAPVEACDIGVGEVIEGKGWRATAEEVAHGHGLPTMPASFLRRWVCYGWRFEVAGKVFVFSGDTVDCPGLRRLAQGADVLAMCCHATAAQLTTPHLRDLARYTLACGDTVGKIAAECGVGKLVLTHHRPGQTAAVLETLAEEVARYFSGPIVMARDGLEVAL
jgi:ribonuclease Z